MSNARQGDNDVPPSYESVLNADFGDPTPPSVVASPPFRAGPPTNAAASLSQPPPPPPRPIAPTYRSERQPRQRPYSSTFPRRPPAYTPHTSPPAPVVTRRRTRSEARPQPRRTRRATSPGPRQPDLQADFNAEISPRRPSCRGRPYSQSCPVVPTQVPTPRPRRHDSTPGSVEELLALTESRKTSFFASNKKTTRLVHSSVLEFTTQLDGVTDATRMLQTLEKACAMCNLSLSLIIREGRIHGHSPLYWALLDGRSDPVIKALLQWASGGLDDEIRLAAIIRADWRLFQRVRHWLGIPGRVKVDEMDDGKRFVVHLQDLSKETGVEFIARGRLWLLLFSPGSVTLTLQSHSPQTFVDARFHVISPTVPVEVSMSSYQQLQPPDRRGRVKGVSGLIPVNVSLERARLEVKLCKPEDGDWCVIC